ncbi:HAMP domain-containing protein [Corallococcus sp. AB049A]|uniref:histidine kinase n=1 Tax=Corallococcus interemptor TaxID=2316720 RepID=A0A3A8QXD9_9BACT|nr:MULTISPECIES: sensor histidine kinase [Corallococcus]RKH72431.1 HAMP domain-containing protein [Corallococcus interemptor]RKI74701.1 HAMP domain-containing protein [Corallococcus sp. AB049A]
MRLYQQLILFMLAATVLPLAIVGFLLLSRSELALAQRIDEQQRSLATSTAEAVEASLMEVVNGLARSAELLPWERATPEEVRGMLMLLYGQSTTVSAVIQADADGQPLGPAVFRSAEPLEQHPAFDAAGVAQLAHAVPVGQFRDGGKGQAALGSAYVHAGSGVAAVAVAVKLGASMDAPYAIAELVFTQLEALLARRASDGQRLDVVDSQGRVVASSQPARRMAALEPELKTALASAQGVEDGRSFQLKDPARRVSVAWVNTLEMGVVVTEDEALALTPVRELRTTVLASVAGALLVLLALGALFTRRLDRRLAQVVQGAEAYGRGELERRLPVEGQDELSELASTFNRMGEELEASRARLMSWNDDLRVRVEEATADLRAAQLQLVEAQKLAAVGQLGAGVAHEINNPLAGILGNVQLLLLDRGADDVDFETLRKIEQSAKRCKDITQNLLRFSQQRERPDLRPVDLNAVVRDALSLTENQTLGEGIELLTELSTAVPRVKADPGHLSQVVLALLSNARTAMLKTPVKKLTLRTGERDGMCIVEVEDTGKGIAESIRPRIFEPFFTTKDIWSNVGLGLSVAWRIVTEAGGTLEVRSEEGQGARFTVVLPRA